MKSRLAGGLAALALLGGCGAGADVAVPPEVDETSAAAVLEVTTPPAPEPTSTPSSTPSVAPVSPSPSATEVTGTGREQTHTPSAAGQVVRVVGVSDGDSLRVSVDGVTERLRIIGIDAPELSSNDCYAQQSASKMQSLVQSSDVRIVADPTQADRDVYDRILRHVFTLDGTDVGHAMIVAGLAKEYTYDKAYASQAQFRDAEAVAREAGLGIWGECDIVRAEPVPLVGGDDDGQCVIKGNINRKKEKIYHVPGQRHYDETIIDEFNGERWFCTEEEAVDAGWRKSKR